MWFNYFFFTNFYRSPKILYQKRRSQVSTPSNKKHWALIIYLSLIYPWLDRNFIALAVIWYGEGIYVYNLILLAITSLLWERCCVLFNIGALQSQIACTQSVHTDDGLKTASKLFQVTFFLGNFYLIFFFYLCYKVTKI